MSSDSCKIHRGGRFVLHTVSKFVKLKLILVSLFPKRDVPASFEQQQPRAVKRVSRPPSQKGQMVKFPDALVILMLNASSLSSGPLISLNYWDFVLFVVTRSSSFMIADAP